MVLALADGPRRCRTWPCCGVSRRCSVRWRRPPRCGARSTGSVRPSCGTCVPPKPPPGPPAWALEPERSQIVIDIDATIVCCRSDKQDAAGTWKRTYGFHPLIAMDTERREVLAQLVRPGNAGSNTAVDHAEILEAAIDAL
ncbi:MAG: transposase, partial [Acidimicrobiia bacterium]|nr:transposase [Acidimicrobiia bacterium]